MTTTEPAAQVHEAGFYGSDEEFRRMTVPWIEEGIAAGEKIIIGYDRRKSALLHSWLPDPSRVTFMSAGGQYPSPARALSAWRSSYRRYLDQGVPRIRAAGDVPHADDARRYAGWDRYEMALNTVWDGMPIWSRCLYDAASTPAAVRDMVERTHPRLLAPTGETAENRRFQDLGAFRGLPATPDPITTATAAAVTLHEPAAAEARAAVRHAARGLIDDDALDQLVRGVSETVTNAHQHGQPPVTLRVWTTPGRVVAHVTDAGNGTTDPLAGLLPCGGGASGPGLGLWISGQLDLAVDLLHSAGHFTVQLAAAGTAAGSPPAEFCGHATHR